MTNQNIIRSQSLPDPAVRAVLRAYPTLHAAWRRRHLREPRSGARLSPHLAGLLEHLDPDHPIAVGELARRVRVTPATVSLQLARLARLRLVVRTRDAQDGRRVLLRLTEAGARLREARSLLDPERVRAALARLSARERERAVAGLRALARAAALASLPSEPAVSGGAPAPTTPTRIRRKLAR